MVQVHQKKTRAQYIQLTTMQTKQTNRRVRAVLTVRVLLARPLRAPGQGWIYICTTECEPGAKWVEVRAISASVGNIFEALFSWWGISMWTYYVS